MSLDPKSPEFANRFQAIADEFGFTDFERVTAWNLLQDYERDPTNERIAQELGALIYPAIKRLDR